MPPIPDTRYQPSNTLGPHPTPRLRQSDLFEVLIAGSDIDHQGACWVIDPLLASDRGLA